MLAQQQIDPIDLSTTKENLDLFLDHTEHGFSWNECETLIRTADEPTVYKDQITLEEALDLIEIGYTPIPF